MMLQPYQTPRLIFAVGPDRHRRQCPEWAESRPQSTSVFGRWRMSGRVIWFKQTAERWDGQTISGLSSRRSKGWRAPTRRPSSMPWQMRSSGSSWANRASPAGTKATPPLKRSRACALRELRDGVSQLCRGDHRAGDRVVVLARGEVKTVRGEDYNNEYCFVFRMREGKVLEVREYCDTALQRRA